MVVLERALKAHFILQGRGGHCKAAHLVVGLSESPHPEKICVDSLSTDRAMHMVAFFSFFLLELHCCSICIFIAVALEKLVVAVLSF